jgi:lactate dehydrogenase-like 2-hydroxyacid dehydrogenase
MKIAVIDDYQDAFRTLRCYQKLVGHEVLIYKDTEKDPARLAKRLKEVEAVILTQARSPFPRAVDVFEEEPALGTAHPLLKMDNVIATPHLGYVEKENYELYYGLVVDQILAYAAGKPINVLNPEAIRKK